jgi:tetratricopeptide (TPR) repeat protein
MNNSHAEKDSVMNLRRMWVFVLGPLLLFGCGPSKEQQAIDARNSGLSHFENGEYDNAIADFTEAIRLNPKLAEAIRLSPEYALAYTARGTAYARKGKHDLAIDDYTEAIKFNTEFPFTYVSRGLAHKGKGDSDNAIVDFTEAIRLYPKLGVAYHNRGLAHQEMGDHTKAEADFAKAEELGYKSE